MSTALLGVEMKVLDGFPSTAPGGSLKIFAVERETRVPVWISPKG